MLAELERQAGTLHDAALAAASPEIFADRGYRPADWRRSWRGVV